MVVLVTLTMLFAAFVGIAQLTSKGTEAAATLSSAPAGATPSVACGRTDVPLASASTYAALAGTDDYEYGRDGHHG